MTTEKIRSCASSCMGTGDGEVSVRGEPAGQTW